MMQSSQEGKPLLSLPKNASHVLGTFEEAFDDEVSGLREEYEADLDDMSYGMSAIHEAGFTEWLRGQGYATYYA